MSIGGLTKCVAKTKEGQDSEQLLGKLMHAKMFPIPCHSKGQTEILLERISGFTFLDREDIFSYNLSNLNRFQIVFRVNHTPLCPPAISPATEYSCVLEGPVCSS